MHSANNRGAAIPEESCLITCDDFSFDSIEKLDHLPLPAAKCKQVAGDMSALYAHVLGQGDVENGPIYGRDSPFCRTTELPQWCVYSRSSVRSCSFFAGTPAGRCAGDEGSEQ